MAGSGHADCQNASPWYSCRSHALHRTAVKWKRTLSTAESPSASSAVETRLASCWLPVSAPGVQHHGHQRTDRQHDSGDRKQEGRLADSHSLRPPSQQPERDDEDGEQENIAGQFKDRAQCCTPNAQRREGTARDSRSFLGPSGGPAAGPDRDRPPDTTMQIRESSVRTTQHPRRFSPLRTPAACGGIDIV